MTPLPVGSAPSGIGGNAFHALWNEPASGGPSSGIALMRFVIGCTTALGASSTGVPGAPCTLVAQLPMRIGVLAAAGPAPSAALPTVTAAANAVAPASFAHFACIACRPPGVLTGSVTV